MAFRFTFLLGNIKLGLNWACLDNFFPVSTEKSITHKVNFFLQKTLISTFQSGNTEICITRLRMYSKSNGTFYLVFPTLNTMVRFLPEKVGKDCLLSIYYFCSVVSYKKLRKRNIQYNKKSLYCYQNNMYHSHRNWILSDLL